MGIRTLVAGTRRRHESEIIDNVINDFILFKVLGDKDLAPKLFKQRELPQGASYAEGLKLTDDPGRKIVEKIRKARNTTVRAYERFDLLSTDPQDNADEVEHDWKSISGSMHLAWEDLDKNSGSKTRIFDLLEFAQDDLMASIQEKVNDYFLGTVPADDLKRPTGLLDWIKDDPTTLPTAGAGVIGGIDASDSNNSYWRNQKVNHAAASFGTDQTGTGHANLRQLIRDCTFGMQRGKIVLAGEDAFEALEKSLANQQRQNDPRVNLLVAAGIDAIIFKNTPVVMEKRIDAVREAAGLSGSAFYVMNPRSLRVWGMQKRWFKLGNFREPTNQDSQVAHCIARLQMTCRGRREQGVMFNVV